LSRILIGPSNIYRVHDLISKGEYKLYTVMCCTNQEVWNTVVDKIKMEEGEVVVIIIENLICHTVIEVVDPRVRKIMIEDVIGSFMAQIKKCALMHLNVKFALLQLIPRPKHGWYTEGYDTLCRMYQENIKTMGAKHKARIDATPVWLQLFEKDGVHLTQLAGKVFVKAIIANAEASFNEEVIELDNVIEWKLKKFPLQ
jgi:hypothetical protein